MSEEVEKSINPEDYKSISERSYNQSGYIGSDKFSGVLFYIDDHEYAADTAGGELVVYDCETRDLVKDEKIVASIKTKLEEDQHISHARGEVAVILSDNNPVLAEILRMHLEYSNGKIGHPFTKDGIDFYEVGHNATHHFYLGIKDGKVYKLSTYYDYDPETHEHISEEHVREVSGDLGYIGHY